MQVIQLEVPIAAAEATNSMISLSYSPVKSVHEAAQRSKRKPPPVPSAALETCLRDYRYPRSDPKDPFAPLADLRRRSLSSLQCLSDSIIKNTADLSPQTPSTARSGFSLQQQYGGRTSPMPVKRESSYIAFPTTSSVRPEAVLQLEVRQRYNQDIEAHGAPHISDVHQHDYHYQPWMKRHNSTSSLQGDSSVTTYNLAPPSYSYRTVSQRLSLVYPPQPPTFSSKASRSDIFIASSESPESPIDSKKPRNTSKLRSPIIRLICRTRSSSMFYKDSCQRSDSDAEAEPFPSDVASYTLRPASPKKFSKLSYSSSRAGEQAFGAQSLQKVDFIPDTSLFVRSKSPLSQITTSGSDQVRKDTRRRTISLIPRSLLRQQVEPATPQSPRPPSYDTAMSDTNFFLSLQQLSTAAALYVVAESGVRVRFGTLWEDRRSIILFFPSLSKNSSDYIRTILTESNISALRKANINLIVIGRGAHSSSLARYRRLVNNNVLVFTDPAQSVYRTLGLAHNPGSTKYGNNQRIIRLVNSIFQSSKLLADLTFDIDHSGGEFVLGPGLNCTFSNRITNADRNTSFDKLLTSACNSNVLESHVPPPSPSDSWSSYENEDHWMERRRLSWLRLQDKRRRRRGAEHYWQESEVLTERRLTIIETAEENHISDLEDSDE